MGASGSSWRSSTAASSTTTIASLPFTLAVSRVVPGRRAHPGQAGQPWCGEHDVGLAQRGPATALT